MKARLESIEVAKKFEITEAVSAVGKERDALKTRLEKAELKK